MLFFRSKWVLQISCPLVDASNPIHHDEVCLLWAYRRTPVQTCSAQATRWLHKGRTAGRHLRCRLHCRCVLRHRISSSRYRSEQVEPREGINSFGSSQEVGHGRFVEGSHAQDRDDWYTYRLAVVHLRRLQGKMDIFRCSYITILSGLIVEQIHVR